MSQNLLILRQILEFCTNHYFKNLVLAGMTCVEIVISTLKDENNSQATLFLPWNLKSFLFRILPIWGKQKWKRHFHLGERAHLTIAWTTQPVEPVVNTRSYRVTTDLEGQMI